MAQPQFLLLWTGQVVSTLGARIGGTALPLLVLATSHDPMYAGFVGAASTLPYLLSLFAGALVDCWNHKRVLLISEIVAGVAVAGTPVALWLGVLTLPQLVVTAFVQGACSVFFSLAETAALPVIVPPERFNAAIAQNESKSRGASLAGAPLGGLLFGMSRTLPFIANAVSYAISAVGILLIKGERHGRPHQQRRSLLGEIAEGLAWTWRQPLARAAVSLVAVSNLVFQALVLILIILVADGGGWCMRWSC